MTDHIIHATIPGEDVRLLAGVTTALVSEACMRHGTYPAVSAALGRTLTGTLLLGLMQKDLERVTVRFDCTGPVRGVAASADAFGNAFGYVKEPHAGLPHARLYEGKLDVGAVVGEGMMYVIREIGADVGIQKEPYRGSVEIVSGEIAQDIAYYLLKSEQIPSGVSLGTLVVGEGEVVAAGGFIVQAMPGADEALLDELTRRIAAAPHASEMALSGATALEMLETALGRRDLEVLETREARFKCTCSPERALGALAALEPAILEEMIAAGRGEEVVCPMCAERYRVGVEAIRELLGE